MMLIIVVRACGKLQLIFIVSNRYHARIYFYKCIYIYILDESHEGWGPMRFRSLTTLSDYWLQFSDYLWQLSSYLSDFKFSPTHFQFQPLDFSPQDSAFH